MVTWTFDPSGDAARVRIWYKNVPVGIGKANHDAGLNISLANLARLVES